MRSDGEFEVGERAVYPVHGVVEVVRIEEKELGGARQRFYVLAILGLDRKILVPTANATAVGLRAIANADQVAAVLAVLAEKPTVFDLQTWNRRARAFADKMKTGNVMDTAEIVRELGWLRAKKPLAFGERRILDTTLGLLVKEISLSRGTNEDLVRAEIEALFGPSELPPT